MILKILRNLVSYIILLLIILSCNDNSNQPSKESIIIGIFHSAPIPMDTNYNRDLIEKGIEIAANNGVNWFITPELSESGYEFNHKGGLKWIENFPNPWHKSLSKIAIETKMTFFIGFPQKLDTNFYNSVAIIDKSGNFQTYNKIVVIPGEGEGWAKPGQPKIFQIDNIQVGYLICADAYIPDYAAFYKQNNADIILSSACWPPDEEMGPKDTWIKRSRETRLPLVVTNTTGVSTTMDCRESLSGVYQNGEIITTTQSPTTILTLITWNYTNNTFDLKSIKNIIIE